MHALTYWLVKNVNNSFKLCLPLPHELSRYIFCWIAIFAFMTLAYRYAFYSRLLIFKKFPEQVMFWPFCMQVSNAFCCLDELCLFDVHYHRLLSPFKSYSHRTGLENKNGSLRLHGGFFLCFCALKYTKTHVINLNTREHFVTLPRHLPSWAVQCIRFFKVNLKCQWTHPLPWEIKLI